jgi:phage gpG-like protein
MARGLSITLEYDGGGLAKPLAALRHLRDMGEDLLPFMTDAKDILLKATLGRFETGRGPGGIPWAPTKRQARQAVGRRGPNKARILVDTGDLQLSIRGEATSNSAEVGSDGLSNPVKALANQFGSHRPSVVKFHTRTVRVAFGVALREPATQFVSSHGRMTNLPARPFVGIDEQNEDDIKEAWQARIIREFGNGG